MSNLNVTRTHLELPAAAQLRAAPPPGDSATLRRVHPIRAAAYRALYRLVGEQWLWRDRNRWTDEELDAYLASPDVYVWTLHVGADVAGYFELKRHSNDDVEIVYFGLAAPFIGRRLGGWMLTRAAEEAFALGAARVILNTCTLDAPQALPNYLARGFTITREEKYTIDAPTV